MRVSNTSVIYFCHYFEILIVIYKFKAKMFNNLIGLVTMMDDIQSKEQPEKTNT